MGFEAWDIDWKAYRPCQTLYCISHFITGHPSGLAPLTPLSESGNSWHCSASLSLRMTLPFDEEVPFFLNFQGHFRNFHDSIFGLSLITLPSSARVGNLAELGQMTCLPASFGGGNENGDVFFLFQAEMGTGGTSDLLVACSPPCGSQRCVNVLRQKRLT